MNTPELSGSAPMPPSIGGSFDRDHIRSAVARADRAWWAGRSRPVRTAVLLTAAPVLLTVVIGVGGHLLFPGSDPILSRLAAVLLMTALSCLVVWRARAWRRVGAAGPVSWRHVRLLAVPLLIAAAPLVTGLHVPAASVLLVLAAGYAATGVFEELWHRGVILDCLRSKGVRRSAVIGGALFATSHLANVAFGQAPAVSAAQAVGAFCFGVGFAVFRWRTNAIWLLAGIHALGDLLFQITNLHGGVLWLFLVGHDTLMLLWGLWCLRGLRNDVTAEPGHVLAASA